MIERDPRVRSERGLTDWGRIIALEALVIGLYDSVPGENRSKDNLADLIEGRMLHYGLENEDVKRIALDTAELVAARMKNGDPPFDDSID